MVDFEEIKSKLSERGSSKEDFEEKVDLLNKMAYDIRGTDPEKSLTMSQVALDTSKKIDYKKGIANSRFNVAFANRKLGNLDEALKGYELAINEYDEIGDILGKGRSTRAAGKTYQYMFKHREALEHLQNSVKLFDEAGEDLFKADALSEIADSYHILHELAIAQEYYIKALEIFMKVDNQGRVSIVYNRIAILNMLLGEEAEALEYYHKSLELKRKLGDKVNEALTLMNIGLISHDKGDYEDAIKYFNQALEINNEIEDKVNGSLCLINIANTLTKQEKFDESEKKLDEAKDVLGVSKDKNYKAHLFMAYANLYIHKKEYYEAIHFVNDAIALAKEAELKDIIMDCYKYYSECHAGLTDFEKAHEYLKKYYYLKGEIFSKEMYERIKNLQYKYEREAALKEAETQKKRGEALEAALKQVEELNDNLRKMNEEKNTFMALVSHDLKNPLNAVLGYAQLVKSNPEHFSEEEYKEMFNDIEISARIMTELITNYLEFTTIEAGKVKLNMRETSISRVARYVCDTFESRAKSKDITLVYKSDPDDVVINADKNALTQVLDNLVSNAIKFSPSGKKIYLTLEEKGSIVLCTIKDEGPGIDSEEMSKLFKKFSKLSAKPTAGESSTGLGLSITKRLTEDMNGRIWCESNEGEGATFFIEFSSLR